MDGVKGEQVDKETSRQGATLPASLRLRVPASPPTRVTVAVPLLNDVSLFPGLLDCILAQTISPDRLQILLADGGSCDGTRALAQKAAETHPHIHFFDNPRRRAAAALNIALAQAAGAYFIRLDARTRPAATYVERCCARLDQGEWAGVAGPQVAAGETAAGRVHALVLNHPLGAGSPRYRRAARPIESETIYLGAYKTDSLRQIGGWDETFDANEDFDLNTRIRKTGGRLLVDPQIRCTYIARHRLGGLWRQYARYGAWRTITWRKHPDALRLRHLAPALLVAAFLLAILLSPVAPLVLPFLLALYLLPTFYASLSLALRHDLRALPRLIAAFVTLHLSWGLAFWLAWLRPPSRRP